MMGVIGAFIGGYLFRLAGIHAGGAVGSIIVATIGAVLLVIVVKAIRKV